MKIKNNELKEMANIANTNKNDYSTAIEIKENELLVQFNANYLYSLKGQHSMELGLIIYQQWSLIRLLRVYQLERVT